MPEGVIGGAAGHSISEAPRGPYVRRALVRRYDQVEGSKPRPKASGPPLPKRYRTPRETTVTRWTSERMLLKRKPRTRHKGSAPPCHRFARGHAKEFTTEALSFALKPSPQEVVLTR